MTHAPNRTNLPPAKSAAEYEREIERLKKQVAALSGGARLMRVVGVSRVNRTGRWRAVADVEGEAVHLGCSFGCRTAAAIRHDRAVRHYHGANTILDWSKP